MTSKSVENDVAIFERLQPQFGIVRHPRAVAEDEFVIARDHPNAVGRLQIPQRRDVGAPRVERAVDQVARDRDQVRAKRVRSFDDGAHPGFGKQPADVEIGQLQDGVAIECVWKSGNADLDIFQRRNPHRLLDADRGSSRGQRRQAITDAIGRADDATADQACEQ